MLCKMPNLSRIPFWKRFDELVAIFAAQTNYAVDQILSQLSFLSLA
jgi:hypothetical protein